jgi:hypothetical protein
VIIAERDYKKFTSKHPDFKTFLMGEGPRLEGLDLGGDGSRMRRVDL